MRIPINKLHRAFPRLDQFSDEQCEQFIARVSKVSGYETTRTMAVTTGVIVTLLLCLIGQCALGGVVFDLLVQKYSQRYAGDWATLIILLWWTIVPAIGALVSRDLILWHRLKRLIVREIDRIRCLHCSYSLLGQRASAEDQVRCPECGRSTALSALGLQSSDDLLPPPRELSGGVRDT